MNFVLLSVLLLVLSPMRASSFEIEGWAGARSVQFDSVPDANEWGLSARGKINFYSYHSGFFVATQQRGLTILAGDLHVGYGMRTSGKLFAEIGGGLAHSAIFGSGLSLLLSSGYRVSDRVFLTFPILLTLGGASFLSWGPQIGYTFD